MTQYKIHPLPMGTKIFDKTMMTYQHEPGRQYVIPIYCWYIEEETKNPGGQREMHPICSEEREKAIGGKIYTFEEGLAKYGLKPEDIDIVIHTHLHNDHCENDYKCVNAEFFVHEKEIERIYDPHPLDYRYLEDYFCDVHEAGQVTAVSEDREVLPGISVMHTPAHTEGGMTVMIDTSSGKAAITGFCCIMENFEPPVAVKAMEMEVIPPGTHVNVYDAYDIMLKVKHSADILIPLHEPRFAAMDVVE